MESHPAAIRISSVWLNVTTGAPQDFAPNVVRRKEIEEYLKIFKDEAIPALQKE